MSRNGIHVIQFLILQKQMPFSGQIGRVGNTVFDDVIILVIATKNDVMAAAATLTCRVVFNHPFFFFSGLAASPLYSLPHTQYPYSMLGDQLAAW